MRWSDFEASSVGPHPAQPSLHDWPASPAEVGSLIDTAAEIPAMKVIEPAIRRVFSFNRRPSGRAERDRIRRRLRLPLPQRDRPRATPRRRLFGRRPRPRPSRRAGRGPTRALRLGDVSARIACRRHGQCDAIHSAAWPCQRRHVCVARNLERLEIHGADRIPADSGGTGRSLRLSSPRSRLLSFAGAPPVGGALGGDRRRRKSRALRVAAAPGQFTACRSGSLAGPMTC